MASQNNDQNAIVKNVKDFVREYVGEFKATEDDDLIVRRMNGFSNDVFLVKSDTYAVIFKKLKPDDTLEAFSPFKKEIEQITRRNNYGPKMYFEGSGYIIEEYIKAEELVPEDILNQDVRLLAMEPLANFSRMQYDPEELNSQTWHTYMVEHGLLHKAEKNIQKVREEGTIPDDIIDLANRIINIETTSDLLKSLRNKYNSGFAELILCHNDFYYMNLMRDHADADKYHLIDYEFGCVNPFGWDIANMLVENMSVFNKESNRFELKLENFPSRKEIVELVKAFSVRFYSQEDLPTGRDFLVALRNGEYDSQVDKDLLEDRVDRIFELCFLLNYNWLFWCVLKLGAEVEFPLLNYIKVRFELFFWFKEKVIHKNYQ